MFNILKQEASAMGFDTAYPEVGQHQCMLPVEMDHGMHLLHPTKSSVTRTIRFFRLLTLPTYAHRQCRYYYKSRKKMVEAWKTMAATRHPPIVHPFSLLILLWEMVMLLTWTCLSFIRPYMFTFYLSPYQDYTIKILVFISAICCTGILVINIILNFCTGYDRGRGLGIVVISFKKIAIRYLYTYFVFDILNLAALVSLLLDLRSEVDTDSHQWQLIHLLHFVRSYSCYVFAQDIGHILKLQYLSVDVIWFVLLHFVMIHWLGCFLCVMHKNLAAEVKYDTMHNYIEAIKTVATHFLQGSCNFRTIEIKALTLTMIIGWVCRVVSIGYLMMYISKHGRGSRRYYTFVREINKYMSENKISFSSSQRINNYVSHKYHGKRYREDFVKRQLSQHLRNEALLHSAGHFICVLKLCQHLKRSIVGELLTQLKPTLLASGDVLFLWTEPCATLYFISYGKIACYTQMGVELAHFSDGSLVGVIGLYKSVYQWTGIAIDTTEAFAWSRSDAEMMARKHKSVADFLHYIYINRVKVIQQVGRGMAYPTPGATAHINAQLAEKKILERRQLRFQHSSNVILDEGGICRKFSDIEL